MVKQHNLSLNPLCCW